MWRFFPQFRGFRGSFGDFCSCLRNFSASASIPWLRLWCGLFCSVCLFSTYLYPTVAGLVGFSCGTPSLVVPVCVWGFFLRRRSCVFFFSSCSMWGRLLLSLFLGRLRFSAAYPAAGYPSCFRNLSGSKYLAYSCSGHLLLGWRCLGTPLGFLPCASAASPVAAYP